MQGRHSSYILLILGRMYNAVIRTSASVCWISSVFGYEQTHQTVHSVFASTEKVNEEQLQK